MKQTVENSPFARQAQDHAMAAERAANQARDLYLKTVARFEFGDDRGAHFRANEARVAANVAADETEKAQAVYERALELKAETGDKFFGNDHDALMALEQARAAAAEAKSSAMKAADVVSAD